MLNAFSYSFAGTGQTHGQDPQGSEEKEGREEDENAKLDRDIKSRQEGGKGQGSANR